MRTRRRKYEPAGGHFTDRPIMLLPARLEPRLFHVVAIWHLNIDETLVGRHTLRFRRREPLFSILLDTGLAMLDSLRDRLPDNVDDIKDRVRDTYGTASQRVSRATDVLRGEEDSQILGKAIALAIGVGIGVGIGLLIAPASGDETRADIADKVSDFSDQVRERTGKKPRRATGIQEG